MSEFNPSWAVTPCARETPERRIEPESAPEWPDEGDPTRMFRAALVLSTLSWAAIVLIVLGFVQLSG